MKHENLELARKIASNCNFSEEYGRTFIRFPNRYQREKIWRELNNLDFVLYPVGGDDLFLQISDSIIINTH